MSEWKDRTLGDLSTQRKGINYKSEDYGDEHSGHPFITIKCFVKGGGYEPTGIKFYDGFSTKADHLSPGDLLFSVTDLTRAGDIVGSPLRVPDFGSTKPALASMDCMRIEPIANRCNKRFLYHRLMLSDVRRQMIAYAAGSTVLHLDTKKVPCISVRIPVDVNVQSKIAFILDGIDTAIEKTEALIAKYQQIKAGLMHDLFTRGVLPNGQLRPPREQAPELHQETAIGWIPKGWEINTLGQLCEMTSGGTPSRSIPAYWGGSIPWVKTGEIKYEDISQTEEYITLKGLGASSAKVFPAGTIVMAMYGEGITRGRVAVLAVPCASNQACIGFSFGNQTQTKYMYYFFEHCYEELRDLSNDGSQKNLSSGLLKQFQIRFPTSKAEQDCIASRLSNLDQRIASEKKYLQNLCQQKLGLMHDLLTGKVPVKVKEPEAVDG